MTKFYTTKEISQLYGVTVRRVQAMIHQNIHFPNVKKQGRDWLIPESDINEKKVKKIIK